MKSEKKQYVIVLLFLLMNVVLLVYQAFSNPIPRNMALAVITAIALVLFAIRLFFEDKMTPIQRKIMWLFSLLGVIVGFWIIFLM